jgi:prepilin-type N-terminal cleavage/methylation domain-containing protein
MKKSTGFTLIELVIVIVIIGILAAVAIPRYLDLSDEATTAAKAGMEGAVKSAFAIAIAEQRPTTAAEYPTVADLNGRLSPGDTTAAATGIQFDIGSTTYTVQTYTDDTCSTATTATTSNVLCVGTITP